MTPAEETETQIEQFWKRFTEARTQSETEPVREVQDKERYRAAKKHQRHIKNAVLFLLGALIAQSFRVLLVTGGLRSLLFGLLLFLCGIGCAKRDTFELIVPIVVSTITSMIACPKVMR